MSIFEKEVLKPIQDAMSGNMHQVPIHLSRVQDVISIRKAIYTLVGGNTGSGKTSFVDDTYVLSPYDVWQKWKDETDVTFRVLYRSMERKRGLKLAKWACWKMYQTTGLLVDSDTLLGYRKTKVNENVWNAVVDCRDWADKMLDYVDIRDGRTSPAQYDQWVTNHALRQGTLFISDEVGVKNAQEGIYIDTFDKGKAKTLDNGDVVPIVEYSFGGKSYTLKSGEKMYFPKREKEITVVIADHLGKFVGDPGLSTKKAIVDKASEHNSDFRDVFSYSPVAVSQFNRAVGDVQRIKYADGDLSPQLEDFKDSGGSQEDADLVMTLFNPFRYKAYNEHGMYKGYNIRDRMVNPSGYNRYRLLSILKNSYGVDDVDFGLKFMGEINSFSTLPKPGPKGISTPELEQVYNQISQGF